MYDHILSVKAPFIMDLFSIAQTDVEEYAESLSYIPSNGLDNSIKKSITEKNFLLFIVYQYCIILCAKLLK